MPAVEADGEHPGPGGFFRESWTITCSAPDGTLLSTSKVLVDKGDVANISLCTPAGVGGTVPAALSLSMGAPATFGAFTPGIDKEYAAQTTANVILTAGDAALTLSEPGHLTNGAFSLPEALRVEINPATWTVPVSNAPRSRSRSASTSARATRCAPALTPRR